MHKYIHADEDNIRVCTLAYVDSNRSSVKRMILSTEHRAQRTEERGQGRQRGAVRIHSQHLSFPPLRSLLFMTQDR